MQWLFLLLHLLRLFRFSDRRLLLTDMQDVLVLRAELNNLFLLGGTSSVESTTELGAIVFVTDVPIFAPITIGIACNHQVVRLATQHYKAPRPAEAMALWTASCPAATKPTTMDVPSHCAVGPANLDTSMLPRGWLTRTAPTLLPECPP